MTGAITWHELYTSDVDAVTRFYTELLGLELETADMGDFQYPMLRKDGRRHEFMEGYRLLKAGETPAGGLMLERGGSPAAYWLATSRSTTPMPPPQRRWSSAPE